VATKIPDATPIHACIASGAKGETRRKRNKNKSHTETLTRRSMPKTFLRPSGNSPEAVWSRFWRNNGGSNKPIKTRGIASAKRIVSVTFIFFTDRLSSPHPLAKGAAYNRLGWKNYGFAGKIDDLVSCLKSFSVWHAEITRLAAPICPFFGHSSISQVRIKLHPLAAK
jgi:hypothetical protein